MLPSSVRFNCLSALLCWYKSAGGLCWGGQDFLAICWQQVTLRFYCSAKFTLQNRALKVYKQLLVCETSAEMYLLLSSLVG